MLHRKILQISSFIVAMTFATSAKAVVYEASQWMFAPHVGLSPAKFNTPFGLTVLITDNPTLPAEIVSLPSNDVPAPDLAPGATIGRTAKANYNKMYKRPLSFGLDIGYMVADNIECFFGYEFLRAQGKTFTVFNQTLNNVNYNLTATVKSYDAHMGYVGARKYFDVHSHFVPYVGLKLGGAQNKQGIAHLKLTNGVQIAGLSKFDVPAYFNTIGFVGGPQVGFDFCITNSTSIYLAAEMLYKTSFYCDTRHVAFDTKAPGSVKLCSRVTQFGTTAWVYPMSIGLRFKR